MYHYIMYKKTVFFSFISIFLFIPSFCSFSGAHSILIDENDIVVSFTKSPGERWNYNKEEDKINHYKKMANTRYKDDNFATDIRENKGDKRINRPGSPRDRY